MYTVQGRIETFVLRVHIMHTQNTVTRIWEKDEKALSSHNTNKDAQMLKSLPLSTLTSPKSLAMALPERTNFLC